MSSVLARIRARRPLWAIYPTRRLALATLILSVFWLLPGAVGRDAGMIGAVLLGLAVVADYLQLPRRRHLVVERQVPESVGLGDPASIVYTIQSDWSAPLHVQLFDAPPSGLESSPLPGPRALAPRALETIVAPITGRERGRYTFDDPALRVTTSIGFLARLTRHALPASVVVVPSLANVRRFRLLAMQHRLSEAGIRALKQRGEGNAFAGLRDYVPGDDPRLVDWKATARHARLITREHTVERSQSIVTMIDCGRAMTQLAGAYPRFEHVLSAAMLLSDVAATGGDRVGLIAFDDQIRALVAPQRGAAALRALRTAMSQLAATLTEPDYASAFRVLATRQRRRALVVFFTDVIDVRAARQLVAYARRAVHRHAILVVAIQNEELIAAARPSTAGSLALYRSAAAEELVREREESLARMRQAGITVLDVAPTRMAAAVVNRYLEIKARGGL